MRKKRTDFTHVQPLGLTTADVARIYGSEQIRRELEKAGELTPFFRRKSMKLYDANEVRTAWARFRAGQTTIPLVK